MTEHAWRLVWWRGVERRSPQQWHRVPDHVFTIAMCHWRSSAHPTHWVAMVVGEASIPLSFGNGGWQGWECKRIHPKPQNQRVEVRAQASHGCALSPEFLWELAKCITFPWNHQLSGVTLQWRLAPFPHPVWTLKGSVETTPTPSHYPPCLSKLEIAILPQRVPLIYAVAQRQSQR